MPEKVWCSCMLTSMMRNTRRSGASTSDLGDEMNPKIGDI